MLSRPSMVSEHQLSTAGPGRKGKLLESRRQQQRRLIWCLKGERGIEFKRCSAAEAKVWAVDLPVAAAACFESTQNTEKAPRLVGDGSDAALQRQSFREAAAAAEAACLAIKGEKKIAFQVLGEREEGGVRGLGRSGAGVDDTGGGVGEVEEWRVVLEELMGEMEKEGEGTGGEGDGDWRGKRRHAVSEMMGGNGRKREREQEERGTEIGRGKRRHAVSGNETFACIS
ncbi:unnamed protein product [Closterium sp. NIES-64]|nr:unnamed protein product [Closterium sp. NIES-64]